MKDCQGNYTTCKNQMKDQPNNFHKACIVFLMNCTSDQPEDNSFNDWRVLFKTLSMAAGELTYDDMPFEDGPVHILTFTLFIILVLFVIMNLMTSIAVNDIKGIQNDSRDSTWTKLMNTLMWYDAVLPECLRKLVMIKPEEEKCATVIEFRLNEPLNLTNFLTYFTKMPKSVNQRAKDNSNQASVPSAGFTMEHHIDNINKIIILIGTKKNYEIVFLEKGIPKPLPIKMWKKTFAFVDYKSGYDHGRKRLRAQQFKAIENTSLEMTLDGPEFKLMDKNTGKPVPISISTENYENVILNDDLKTALRQYDIEKDSRSALLQ